MRAHCIRYPWMNTILGVVVKLLHFHLFCYLLVLHVIWCCFFHFFEFLLVFYFFHYFHPLLRFQCVYILLFQNCYFFCLLRLNFFFLAQLRIKAIFTSAFNESLHMGFDKRSINNIYYSWSCFKIFGQQKIYKIFQVITVFFSYRFMLILYNLKNKT